MTTIETRLERMERKLALLVQDTRKKPEWVRVTFIMQATGWTKERLRQARADGVVKFQKRDDGFWYDINSINPLFVKS